MRIFVTLTTRPERLISDHFRKVVRSLQAQTVPFDKMILNLSYKEFNYVVPEYLYEDSRIDIHYTEICGPCAKLLGSIDILPENTVVIVMDDDIVMRSNFIQSLYDSYLANPMSVSSHFVTMRPNFVEVAGFGGYVFHRDRLATIGQFYETMPPCCRTIDDTWLSWCMKKLGVPVLQTIETQAWHKVLDIPNTDPHPDWYELCKHSNRQKVLEEALQLLCIP